MNNSHPDTAPLVAIVLPCYKVRNQIVKLLSEIGPEASHIILVDDACPEKSGEFAASQINDPRLEVITHTSNQGVGGAVVTGIHHALRLGVDIVVKLDGDGQYDPALIPYLIRPIIEGSADCVKGNRFFNLDNLAEMPAARVFGNAVLSFINKLVSGYWDIMDPTNGFIAVHANILRQLPLNSLDQRYFFESDLLFRLGIVKAVIQDLPLQAFYRDETSSLHISQVILSFPGKYLNRLFKRIVYNYFLRDFNMGSVSLLAGTILVLSGGIYGGIEWSNSIRTGIPATAGMVMISALQLLVGMNFLISFLNYDIGNTPRRVQYRLLQRPGAVRHEHS